MIELPDEWSETTVGEVAKVQTGPFGSQLHNEDYVDVGTPMITVEHIANDKINHSSGIPKVSNEDKQRLSKYILNEGDIVFSRVGSVDRSAYVSSQEHGWMFSGRLLRVRGDLKLINSHYLHFALTKKSTKDYIKKIAVGATMPSINTSILSEIPLVIPPLLEQKYIAKILSSLDEKTELLREQNETLETLAQTIFKEWFVNFNYPDATGEMVDSEFGEIPKGWHVGSLLDIFELIGGGTPKTTNKEYWGGNIPWYSVVDAPNGSNSFVINTEKNISETGLKNSSTKLLRKGTTIVSARGSVGKLAIVGQEMAMNQSCYGINGKGGCGDYYVHFQVKDILKTLKNNVHGAVFDTITTSTFASIKVPIPLTSEFNDFEVSITPTMEKILNNVYQIQTLTKTRDTLLPKLMSGEVRAN